jgi:large repetitive protein
MAQTWSKVSGSGIVIFSDLHSLTSDITFSLNDTYILRLTDDGGSTDDVSIFIVSNDIDAGNDKQALLSYGVDLLATYPTQVTAATYLWSKISGPGDVTFSAPTALATHVNFTENGVYELMIVATNGPLSTRSYIIITVLDLAALPGL